MKLTGTFQSAGRSSAQVGADTGSSVFGAIVGRFGRSRDEVAFPAEAERLITPAELKKLSA